MFTVEDRLRVWQQGAPLFGERYTARQPVEDPYPDLGLERRDLP
jgi:hypothetical protein